VRLVPRAVEQGELATALFAEDPTLFQAPNRKGFSGRVWLTNTPPGYRVAAAAPPDVWLGLGGRVWKPDPVVAAPAQETPVSLAPPQATEFQPSAIFLEADPPPPASKMRIAGDLAGRKLVGKAVHLSAQPGLQLVMNTVVQLGVDASGEVISARLTGDSGSAAANAAGLTAAKGLRFEPAPGAGAKVTWGEAIFSWQTVEPQATGGK
jgi:TonB family protein